MKHRERNCRIKRDISSFHCIIISKYYKETDLKEHHHRNNNCSRFFDSNSTSNINEVTGIVHMRS